MLRREQGGMISKLVPETHQDLLRDETRAFAFLATIMPDGSPQLTPVWFNTDGESILINSSQGRVKDRNMRARPEVALLILDPQNSYRYIQIRGKVVDMTTEAAVEHINQLSLKYTGNPEYQRMMPGMVRVKYRIMPDKVSASG